MKRHVLTLGLTVTFSSFLLAQPIAQSERKIPEAASGRLQLAMASSPQEQEVEKPSNRRLSKQEKKARKKQQKEEKKRRKQEAKQREKEIKRQQKQIAKQQQKELKRENKQIAKAQQKQRKREEKEQSKAMKKGAQQSGAQNAKAAPPAPAPAATASAAPAPAAPNESRSTPAPATPASAGSNREHENPESAKIIRPAESHTREAESHRSDRDRASTEGRREYREHGSMLSVIPVSTTAAPGALAAQRNVSRAIYSQVPNSNVIVLVNNYNQIVLRGSAPTPSLRHRLLQLAGAAASGYSIVDQLASDAVSGAAGAATSAAIGGVSDLIHGSGSDGSAGTSSGPYYSNQGQYGTGYPSNGTSGPYIAGGPDTSPPYGPPPDGSSGLPNGSNAALSGLAPGSRGCVNVYNNNQVFLTGEASSQADAERFRQFAQQLGGANATVIDQLGTRSNGANSSTPANAGASQAAGPNADSPAGPAPQGPLVTPGSVVCIDADNSNEVLLTGTVGSPAEFAKVEQSVQPLLGNDRLIDELTTGTIEAASEASGAGGTAGTASASAGSPGSPSAPSGAIGSSSQTAGLAASGPTLPISQSEVQQALHSMPSLSNVEAQVTGNAVLLSGTVDSAEQEQMAREIAQQYAPGRKVIDDLTINPRANGR